MTMKKIFLLLIAIAITGISSGRTHAQNAGWSAPEQLSLTGNSSWFPDIIADQTGRVHVVWTSTVNRYDSVFYTTRASAADVWSAGIDVMARPVLPDGSSAATRPALAIDQAGMLHMTFRDVTGSGTIFYTRAPAGAATTLLQWSDPVAMDSSGGSAYYSRLAVDSTGVLHLVTSQLVSSEDCPACYQIFYRQSRDGGKTWSFPIIVSDHGMNSSTPWILVDAKDHLHVVFGSNGFVYYVNSLDGGKAWSVPLNLSPELPAGSSMINQAIAIDREGKLIVVSLNPQTDIASYQISRDDGASWSATVAIPRVFGGQAVYSARFDTYSMATDSAGNVHLLMVGRLSKQESAVSVLHLVWNGQQWSAPESLVKMENGDVAEWPRIAVGLGNVLHAAWFTRDKAHVFASDSPSVDYRVWYATSMTNAPMIAPAIYPTPVPTPIPTPKPRAQIVQPTALAFDNRALGNVDYQNLRTEVDDYGMLLLSGLPVALLFILGYFVFRRRQP